MNYDLSIKKFLIYLFSCIIIVVGMNLLALTMLHPASAQQIYTPKLEVLEKEFGFKIALPKDWIETPIGVIHPPKMLFSYIWHPPSPARLKDKKAELVINVFNNPSQSLHLTCFYYPEVWREEVNKSGGIFLGLQTGSKVEADSELVKSMVFWNEKQGLMGCWFGAAYLCEDNVVEAGANVFSEKYLLQVRLLIDRQDYQKHALTLNQILDSIRIKVEGWQRPVRK